MFPRGFRMRWDEADRWNQHAWEATRSRSIWRRCTKINSRVITQLSTHELDIRQPTCTPSHPLDLADSARHSDTADDVRQGLVTAAAGFQRGGGWAARRLCANPPPAGISLELGGCPSRISVGNPPTQQATPLAGTVGSVARASRGSGEDPPPECVADPPRTGLWRTGAIGTQRAGTSGGRAPELLRPDGSEGVVSGSPDVGGWMKIGWGWGRGGSNLVPWLSWWCRMWRFRSRGWSRWLSGGRWLRTGLGITRASTRCGVLRGLRRGFGICGIGVIRVRR